MIRPNLLDAVRELKSRPQMYVTHPSYDTVCAYIQGYDHCLLATGHGAVGLESFREWIVTKNHGGVEKHWMQLISNFCRDPATATDDEKCSVLYSLLEEFWADRDTRGIQAITDDYLAVIEKGNEDRPSD